MCTRTSVGIVAALIAVLAHTVGCGSSVRPFPLADPLTEDPDRQHVEERPETYYSPFGWDGLDQTFFRPLTRVFAVDPPGPAANVNAFDEVPNSSWFQNRIGETAMTPEELARGACPDERIDMSGPWEVTAAKPNGANPGFIIRAADGRRYLLKFDGQLQPERATSADVFGSRLYHAVGFHSPCNFIVSFDRDQLVMDPDAEVTNSIGEKVPMTEEDVETVLAAAVILPNGQMRASASLFLTGRPVGPWRYEGTWSADPNDVVDHQDRRELRGGRVLAAWLNHFDTREQNTLAVWMEEEERSYVEHFYIDFGDCFGSDWDWDQLTRRLGHSNYLDLEHVFVDFITLGLISRPWEESERSEIAPEFRYYDVNHFTPQDWRPGYPNPTFARMLDGDAAWMARIIAHIDDEALRAMLNESRISVPDRDEELFRILIGRRDRVLEHYLRVRSPLSHFEVEGEGAQQRLCATDLAVMSGIVDGRVARYESQMYFGDWEEPVWSRNEPLDAVNERGELCIPLLENGSRPADRAGSADEDSLDRYAILDLSVVPEPGAEALPPARLHFYDTAATGFRLVGIERPEDASPPAGQ